MGCRSRTPGRSSCAIAGDTATIEALKKLRDQIVSGEVKIDDPMLAK